MLWEYHLFFQDVSGDLQRCEEMPHEMFFLFSMFSPRFLWNPWVFDPLWKNRNWNIIQSKVATTILQMFDFRYSTIYSSIFMHRLIGTKASALSKQHRSTEIGGVYVLSLAPVVPFHPTAGQPFRGFPWELLRDTLCILANQQKNTQKRWFPLKPGSGNSKLLWNKWAAIGNCNLRFFFAYFAGKFLQWVTKWGEIISWTCTCFAYLCPYLSL